MITGKIPPEIRRKMARYSCTSMLLILFCTSIIAGNTEPETDPAARTAEMIGRLEKLERHDAVIPEFTALVKEIFSYDTPHRESAAIVTGFLLSEENNPGKRYLITEIAGTTTKAAIDYLAGLLNYSQTSEMALMALETIEDEHAGKILISSFPDVSYETRIGIINVLGRRAVPGADEFIAGFVSHSNPDLSLAAIAAFGNSGTEKAVSELTAPLATGSHQHSPALTDALMVIADKLESAGQSARAFKIYSTVFDASPTDPAALAAVRGMIRTTSGNPSEILKDRLAEATPGLRSALTSLAGELPDGQGQTLLEVPGLTDEDRIRLITSVAGRGDKSIHNEAVRFLKHENPQYREAAIFVMFQTATPEDIVLLAGLASGADGREQELLREIIYRIPGQEADELIIREAPGTPGGAGAELIMAIRERYIKDAAPVLFQTAGSDDQSIRMESYRSLGRIAGRDDIGKLARLLTQTVANRERQELERAIYLAAVREQTPESGSEEITAFLESTPEENDKASLISVLGNIKNPNDLDVLIGFLDHDSGDLRLSAIRALSDWPDAGPAPEFKKLLETSDDMRVKILTLRGFSRIILNDDTLGADEKAGELLFGLSVAPNDNEKKLIISGLGSIHSPAALGILADHMDDKGLRPELEAAIISIVPRIIEQHPEKTRDELKRIVKYSDNQEIKKWAEK